LPERFIRRHRRPVCIGQKQRWYVLRFLGAESDVCLSRCGRPEFDDWRWVDYWEPLREVVFFKRKVYRLALEELAPLVWPKGAAPQAPDSEEVPGGAAAPGVPGAMPPSPRRLPVP
jgi:putative (di)nucleoside polyphosphate hydrolase